MPFLAPVASTIAAAAVGNAAGVAAGLSALTGTTIASTALSVSIVTSAVQFTLFTGLSYLLAPKPPKPAPFEVSVQLADIDPIFTAGRAKCIGQPIWVGNEDGGPDVVRLFYFCEGPVPERVGLDDIADYAALYLHDDEVDTNATGYVTTAFADKRYGAGEDIGGVGNTRFQVFAGEADQAALSIVRTLPVDTSAWFAKGLAVGVVEYAVGKPQNATKWYPSGPPEPSFVTKPRLFYDWRDETQDKDDPSTWKPSINPIVILVHQEWALWGRDWDSSIAPNLTALEDAADYCDAVVTRVATDSDAATTEARYTLEGKWAGSQTREDIVRAQLAAFDGWFFEDSGGLLVIEPGRYVAPTITLGEPISYEVDRGIDTDNRINTIVPKIIWPASRYDEVPLAPITDATSVGTYGPLERELDLTWICGSVGQASRVARRYLKKSAVDAKYSLTYSYSDARVAKGQRYLRIVSPNSHAELHDVIIEVTKFEIQPGTGIVVIEGFKAVTDIDTDYVPATHQIDEPETEDKTYDDYLTPDVTILAALPAYIDESGSVSGGLDLYIRDDAFNEYVSFDIEIALDGEVVATVSRDLEQLVETTYSSSDALLAKVVGLAVNTSGYTVRARSTWGGDRVGDWSAETAFDLGGGAPPAPSNVTISAVSDTGFTATFPDAPLHSPPVDGQVYRVRVNDGSWSVYP